MLVAKKLTVKTPDADKTSLDVLVTALKGGESRIRIMKKMVFDLPTPALATNQLMEELRSLDSLLEACGRAIENIGREES
jgi:hypothetical protein